jgi:mono/diheme cytochrome c family protein
VSTWTIGRLCVIAGLIGVAIGAPAQDADRGRMRFEHSCEPCHGDGPGDDGRAMLPGTDALRIKYGGTLPALIERRTDLTADVIRVFVRRGTWSMPPFRPTELTEADIQDIAAYLRATSGAANAR